MPSLNSLPAAPRAESFDQDRIVLFGGSPRTLDVLRLAVIRSDNVLLVDNSADPAVQRLAQRFAVERQERLVDDDIESAASILVAIGDAEIENAVVRKARAAGTPIHVADRPLVSDFNLLEFLERRYSTFKQKA